MASINKIILLGNLGAAPEVRYTSNGDIVANLRLATSESYKDKTGERRQQTEWHRIVLFRRLAEIARDYLSKGSTVYIEGRIKTRKWQDRDGQARYTTEIEAEQLKMLDPAPAHESVPPVRVEPVPPPMTPNPDDDPEPWLSSRRMQPDDPFYIGPDEDRIPF